MFYLINKFYSLSHINIWVLLIWLEARLVRDSYVPLGQILFIISLGSFTILQDRTLK